MVVFMHGRHNICYNPDNNSLSLEWPCNPPFESIPNYRGYDYIAKVLASHGFIVVSVSTNGIIRSEDQQNIFGGRLVPDFGMSARAELLQRHLAIWEELNDDGFVDEVGFSPFDTRFVGKVDLSNVGTMGHSRGGEGVIRHFILNGEQGSPYRIRAVMPLAPVDFNRFVINNVPTAILLPYCDGDVFELNGVHYYDDTRYNVVNDVAPKHAILVMSVSSHRNINACINKILTPKVRI